jgi:hypothetical protein
MSNTLHRQLVSQHGPISAVRPEGRSFVEAGFGQEINGALKKA